MTKKRILPLAMTVAFGLSACGGEQWGDTNDGLPNTGTGTLGDGTATTLLLVGGLVGVGAILSNSDSDSGVVVTTAGNGATGGGSTGNTEGTTGGTDGSTDSEGNSTDGNIGSGNDTDGTGGTNGSNNGTDDGSNGDTGGSNGNNGSDNGADGSNNGTDGQNGNNGADNGTNGSGSDGGNNNSGDNTDNSDNGAGTGTTDGSDTNTGGTEDTSNPDNDPSTILVDNLEPPAWLLGMWRGTDSNGVSQTAFGSAQEIGIGNTGSPLNGYSNIPEVCLHLSQSDDNVFEYNVWYPTADGNDVIINERWENNGDGTLLYTASGPREDQFIMYSTKASNYLAPPQWLQGKWQGASANGDATKIADISSGNITIGDQGGNRTNLYDLASQPKSVVRVNQDDGRNYSVTVMTSGASPQTVSHTFNSTGNNTLNYMGSEGQASMTRQ